MGIDTLFKKNYNVWTKLLRVEMPVLNMIIADNTETIESRYAFGENSP